MNATVSAANSATFSRPSSLSEALDLMASNPSVLLAGGTDFFPGLRDRRASGRLMDLTAITELRGITRNADTWRIGALTTWSDIVAADLPPAFDALKQAAREVGSIQIQNRATVAGNLCNASPAADGVPPLLTLNAQVVIVSRNAVRQVPLHAFILGNRRTALADGEIVSEIRIPADATSGRSCFLKLGSRRYLVISIAMVAARLVICPEGRIAEAAIAVGACSEVAIRLSAVEHRITGCDVHALPPITATRLDELQPIDDVRASAEYRRDAAVILIDRAVRACL